MIKFYKISNSKLLEGSDILLGDAKLVWIDIMSPTKEDENKIESFFSIDIPTREEMHGIEISSRLYKENSALYLTATLITQIDANNTETHSVTFILKDNVLITLRYSELKSFDVFLNRISKKQDCDIKTNFDVLMGIMDSIIDAASDSLKIIGTGLDGISKSIFRAFPEDQGKKGNLQNILGKIGKLGDLNGKFSESLLSLSQLFIYLINLSGSKQFYKKAIDTHTKDIESLITHTNYLSTRVNLLLDASLGMINIRQNAIIKIFSVASVVFLPPTLIASIYGMNFDFMPEVKWTYGYPFAITLMCLSAVLPYYYFKKKGWL